MEDGRFKNTIIVMTSNVGAKYIQKTSSLGFQTMSVKTLITHNEEKLKMKFQKFRQVY